MNIVKMEGLTVLTTKQTTVIIITLLSIVVYCFVFFQPVIHLPQCQDTHNDAQNKPVIIWPDVSGDLFRFVPARNQSLKDCEDLFVGTPAARFNMSPAYVAKKDAFLAEVKRVLEAQLPPGVKAEGYSHQLPTMFKAMHYIASRPTIKNICETGFNLGHSSFNFLTASEDTIVYSFDLGIHGYAHSMADYMNQTFSGRFSVRFGDSTTTIPEFIRSKPDFRCDLIYVDGGHTYDIALADMLNLASLASDVTGGAAIIFDDYPSLMVDFTFGAAWEDMRRWGYIEEKMRCAFKLNSYNRGFVVGRVMKKPIL